MHLLDLPFEHRNWSVGKDFDQIRRYNPLGRVPTLVLDDGEALIESAAILDYLDELAGPQRALLPRAGRPRRDALRIMSIAVGAAEKGVLQLYERAFRPQEKRHPPWVDRCRLQMHAGLAELEHRSAERGEAWLIDEHLTEADVTANCVFTFLCQALEAEVDAPRAYAHLRSLNRRCEALPAFQAARLDFVPPAG